jgi:prepilin-type N-terminal cleavage/methylation domain-containing protein
MQSYRQLSGFTLTEVIITLAIFGALGSLSVIVGFSSYRGFIFREERDTLVMALEMARSQAVNNVCLGSGCSGGKPHGVEIFSGQYLVFQGNSYAARDSAYDQSLPASSLVSHSGATEVDFAQVGGQAQTLPPSTPSVILSDANHSAAISINSEGRIDW